jgi:hypothetical protein
MTQETGYEDDTIIDLNASPPTNVLYGAFHWIGLLCHDG